MHVNFFGVLLWVPNLPVNFVPLDMLDGEAPVQVWSHFLILYINARAINLEDLLTQQTEINILQYQYCCQIPSFKTNCLSSVRLNTCGWKLDSCPSKLDYQKCENAVEWSFLFFKKGAICLMGWWNPSLHYVLPCLRKII